jgi:hypothetical protein
VLPVAVYKLLFVTAGLGELWPYHFTLALAHLACVFCVFVYARRCVGWASGLLAATVVLFLGQAWEIFFVTIGIGYLGSLTGALAALLLLDRHERRADLAAAVLLVLAFSSSSLGVAFVLGICVELAWTRQGRKRLWVPLGPLGLYALWFLFERSGPTHDIHLAEAPGFLFDVAAGAAGALTGVAVVSDHIQDGPLHWLVAGEHVIAVLIAVGLALVIRRRGMTPRMAMLLCTLLVFWILLAVFRAGESEGFAATVSPYSPRYLYPGTVLLLLLFVECARALRPSPELFSVLAFCVALVAVANSVWLLAAAGNLRDQARTARAELGALEVMRDVALRGYVPGASPGVKNVVSGPYLAAVDRLDSSPADTPEELDSASELVKLAADQVMIRSQGANWLRSASEATPQAPVTVESKASGTVLVARSGCLDVRPSEGLATVSVRLRRLGISLTRTTAPVAIRFRRLAAGFPAARAGTAERAVAIRPALGRLNASWHVRFRSAAKFTLCSPS